MNHESQAIAQIPILTLLVLFHTYFNKVTHSSFIVKMLFFFLLCVLLLFLSVPLRLLAVKKKKKMFQLVFLY